VKGRNTWYPHKGLPRSNRRKGERMLVKGNHTHDSVKKGSRAEASDLFSKGGGRLSGKKSGAFRAGKTNSGYATRGTM